MKLWLFTDEKAGYGNYATIVLSAETEKDAKEVVKRKVEDLFHQDLSDFDVREIVPDTEKAGVLCEEFIGT